jgi:hypothetical protein
MYIFVAIHMCSSEYSRNPTKKKESTRGRLGLLGEAGAGRGGRATSNRRDGEAALMAGEGLGGGESDEREPEMRATSC